MDMDIQNIVGMTATVVFGLAAYIFTDMFFRPKFNESCSVFAKDSSNESKICINFPLLGIDLACTTLIFLAAYFVKNKNTKTALTIVGSYGILHSVFANIDRIDDGLRAIILIILFGGSVVLYDRWSKSKKE